MKKSLPSELVSRLQIICDSDFDAVMHWLSVSRIGSFRVNTLKSTITEVETEFLQKWIEFSVFRDFDNIFVFDKKFEYAIKGTNAFYDGKIYLQSIASMLPVLALDPRSWQKILDVCAAPWSKTTQISALQKWNGKIVAIEKNQIRFDKLAYNCRLQWADNVECVKSDALKFLLQTHEMFDKILLDAPCSAEWRIFLDNEKSFGFWSLENILQKAQLQTDLLSLAWQKLLPEWELVYSTCTLAPEENEKVVSDFLNQNPDAELLSIDIAWQKSDFWKTNISAFDNRSFDNLSSLCVRILPTEYTEWFFLAKIKKQAK